MSSVFLKTLHVNINMTCPSTGKLCKGFRTAHGGSLWWHFGWVHTLFFLPDSAWYFGDLLWTWVCWSERRGTVGSVSVIIRCHSAILVSSMTVIYACAARLLSPGYWRMEEGTQYCFHDFSLHWFNFTTINTKFSLKRIRGADWLTIKHLLIVYFNLIWFTTVVKLHHKPLSMCTFWGWMDLMHHALQIYKKGPTVFKVHILFFW